MSGMWERVGAGSGAFYVFAIIVGEQMRMSGAGGGADGVGSVLDPARDPSMVNRVGFALVVLGFAAFLVFLGYMHRLLRRAEGPDGWVAVVALGAGLLHAAVRFVAQAPIMVGAYRRDELAPDLARTLVDLNDAAFVVCGLLLGMYAAAASVVCLAGRVLPRWLAWFGLVAGVLAVAAGTVGIVDMRGYVALPFLAGTLWTLIVSVLLAIGRRRPAAHAEDPVARSVRTGAAPAA